MPSPLLNYQLHNETKPTVSPGCNGSIAAVPGRGLPERPAQTRGGPGCCFELSTARFAARLEGVLLKSFSSISLTLQTPVPDVNLTGNAAVKEQYWKIDFALVCMMDETLLRNLRAKLRSDPNFSTQRHKIWGTVYTDPTANSTFPYPLIYHVKIDRIEVAE